MIAAEFGAVHQGYSVVLYPGPQLGQVVAIISDSAMERHELLCRLGLSRFLVHNKMKTDSLDEKE